MQTQHLIELVFATVGLAYTVMTAIANQSPTSKVGLFCARWAGTAKHIVEAKPAVDAAMKVAKS